MSAALTRASAPRQSQHPVQNLFGVSFCCLISEQISPATFPAPPLSIISECRYVALVCQPPPAPSCILRGACRRATSPSLTHVSPSGCLQEPSRAGVPTRCDVGTYWLLSESSDRSEPQSICKKYFSTTAHSWEICINVHTHTSKHI